MPTVPAIANSDRLLDATATAAQDTFAITWPVIADSETLAVNDLVVEIDGEALDPDDYTFEGTPITGLTGMWNGGDVVLDTPMAGGERVIIYSARNPRRTGNFLEGKSLPFTTLDQLEDDQTIQARDLHLRIKRMITLPMIPFLDGTVDPDTVVTDILNAADEVEGAAEQIAALISGVAPTTVLSATTSSEPGAPTLGDAYLVPSGGWGGLHAQSIAVYTGTWSYLPAVDGQQMWVRDTNTRWKYNSANSAWKKIRSRLVYVSDFVTFAAALSMAAGPTPAVANSGARLVIDEQTSLAANATIPVGVPAIVAQSGKVDLGNFDFTFQNNVMEGPPEEIFIFSGTGRIKGTMMAGAPHVEWFGADPTRNSDSAAKTKTRKAFQYWADYAAQSDMGGIIVYAFGEYTSDDVTVTMLPDAGGRLPVFHGRWGSTNYDFVPATVIAAFSLESGFQGGGIREFTFSGGENTICVDVVGCTGVTNAFACHTAAARGVRYYNRDASMFTEFCTTYLEVSHEVRTAVEYRVDDGNDSFNDSGLAAYQGSRSRIQNYCGLPVVRLTPSSGGTNAVPYSAPFDATIFTVNNPGGGALGPASSDAIIVQNDNVDNRCPTFSGVGLLIEAANTGTIRMVQSGGRDVLFAMPHEFVGDSTKFHKAPGYFVRSVHKPISGAFRIDYEPISNILSYGTAPKEIFTFPGPTGADYTWELEIDIAATNYHYRYAAKISADGGLGGGRLATLGTAIYSLNTAAYGAPTLSISGGDTGVTLTNAAYDGNGVEVAVYARPIGRAFPLAEPP